MKLSEATISILKSLDNPEFMAMDEVKIKMMDLISMESIKKETEFDTIWALAERQGMVRGINEFLQILSNPHR